MLMSEKADVYSFGCVLWEIVTRKLPWEGLSPFNIVTKVAQRGKRPQLPHGVGLEVANLLEGCWQEEPAARPSMEEVLGRLDKMSGLHPVPL
jgi:serine/threonine protein kinase